MLSVGATYKDTCKLLLLDTTTYISNGMVLNDVVYPGIEFTMKRIIPSVSMGPVEELKLEKILYAMREPDLKGKFRLFIRA